MDALDIKLGVSVLDTKNNDPRSNFDGVTGNSPRKLANSPDQSFNAAVAYEIPLANGGAVRLFGDYYYQGDHFKGIVNDITWEISQEQLNARITYTAPSGNWDIGIWGRNITDEALGHGHVDGLTGRARLGRSRIRRAAQLRRNRQLALGRLNADTGARSAFPGRALSATRGRFPEDLSAAPGQQAAAITRPQAQSG